MASTVQLGGVLAGGEIKSLIAKCFHEGSVRRAGYDVRIGDCAVTADGVQEFADIEQVILEPGQSVVVPTQEEFKLPAHIAGNVALKTKAASEGLLLLSGLLIDPEYEGPLHLSLANVGSQPYVLRQSDNVASVQFFPVVGLIPVNLPTPTSSRPKRPLAFLGQLARVSKEFETLKKTAERTADLTSNVITLGIFLVGATILGVGLSTALSIGSNKNLVESIRRATPHSVTGKLLVGVSILSAAWAIYSVALLVRGRQDVQMPAARDYEVEAKTGLIRKRQLHLLWLMLSITLPALAIVGIGSVVPGRVGRYVWPIVIAGVVALWAKIAVHISKPLTYSEIQAETDRLREGDPG